MYLFLMTAVSFPLLSHLSSIILTLTVQYFTHSAAVPAVLHVDIVVEIVPHTLDAQEVVIISGVAVPGQGVDEEVLLDAPTP